jgi:hypothetical protein
LLVGVPAGAHEVREVGELTFVVGWAEEPAFSGFKNAVELIVSRGDKPVEGAELEVEVIFGKKSSDVVSQPLLLEPAFGAPGEYHASLIPTRPGTYTFHVTGTVPQGGRVDEFFTSGEETFDDVHDPAEAQFPVKDPTIGQLAAAVEQLTQSLNQGSGETSTGDGGSSQVLAIVGIALGGLALILAALAAQRARR